MKTAELLRKYVPSVETIGGYARIDNFYDKTEQQLRDMAAVGFANRKRSCLNTSESLWRKAMKRNFADIGRG